jgi:hypothetical protein
MKVFVSGQIEEKSEIRDIYAKLRKYGHTITHDWTQTDPIGIKLKNKVESGNRAAKDITGVVESDIYVLVSNNKNPGKGMYVELGAALALNEVNNKPLVYTIGKLYNLSIFYLHPCVKHFETIEGLIEELASLN